MNDFGIYALRTKFMESMMPKFVSRLAKNFRKYIYGKDF